eukprot:CAMPEP_0194320008 /NCGR_PEP_ID=MMETSP0171-20130528/16404_1 /TAXON_ID=218684 /ORGANISM="Corethron pennatum, Strain L29A3" /LENGTH=481 /DNA_ID=CAMNT_0039077421 /DNA_START=115 /DNA_END=1560 /DNA_ORIENTATION=+
MTANLRSLIAFATLKTLSVAAFAPPSFRLSATCLHLSLYEDPLRDPHVVYDGLLPIPEEMVSTTILVSPIGEFVTDEELSDLVGTCPDNMPRNVPCAIARKCDTSSLGYGFATFATPESAASAIKFLNGGGAGTLAGGAVLAAFVGNPYGGEGKDAERYHTETDAPVVSSHEFRERQRSRNRTHRTRRAGAAAVRVPGRLVSYVLGSAPERRVTERRAPERRESGRRDKVRKRPRAVTVAATPPRDAAGFPDARALSRAARDGYISVRTEGSAAAAAHRISCVADGLPQILLRRRERGESGGAYAVLVDLGTLRFGPVGLETMTAYGEQVLASAEAAGMVLGTSEDGGCGPLDDGTENITLPPDNCRDLVEVEDFPVVSFGTFSGSRSNATTMCRMLASLWGTATGSDASSLPKHAPQAKTRLQILLGRDENDEAPRKTKSRKGGGSRDKKKFRGTSNGRAKDVGRRRSLQRLVEGMEDDF